MWALAVLFMVGLFGASETIGQYVVTVSVPTGSCVPMSLKSDSVTTAGFESIASPHGPSNGTGERTSISKSPNVTLQVSSSILSTYKAFPMQLECSADSIVEHTPQLLMRLLLLRQAF